MTDGVRWQQQCIPPGCGGGRFGWEISDQAPTAATGRCLGCGQRMRWVRVGGIWKVKAR